jgi:hypothetical protein
MGLGIGVTAPLPRKNSTPWPILAEQIESALREELSDPIDAQFLAIDAQEDSLLATIHPGAESLEFSLDGGRIGVMAKISTLGPGYHAHVVEVINRIGRRCNLAWDWAAEGADETGFATTGDYPALQSAMADFLRHLAGLFGEPDPDGCLMINTSLGFSPVGLKGVVTPSGPRTFDWLRETRAGKNVTGAARDFYVWWNQPRDAEYWRKTGELLLWSDVRWRPADDEAEESTMQAAAACFDRALELDPKCPIPKPEVAELRALLDWPEGKDPEPPIPGRIGYYRGDMAYPPFGGWGFTLPGYFYVNFDQDEGVLSIAFPGRSVWLTAFDIDKPVPTGTLIADFLGESPAEADFVENADGPMIARAFIAPDEEDGHEFTALRGVAAVPGAVITITIALDEPMDTEWAIQVFRSLRHQAAEQAR